MYRYGSKHFPIMPWNGGSLGFAVICEALSSSAFPVSLSNGFCDCPPASELSKGFVDCDI